MSTEQTLPKEVAYWCSQSCPICGRDNYVVVRGVVEIDGKDETLPDEGYAFCNCHNIFYCKDAKDPMSELRAMSKDPAAKNGVRVIIPDSFFINMDDPYEFKYWKPRKHSIIWDTDSFCEILEGLGLEIKVNQREFSVDAEDPQTSRIIARKIPKIDTPSRLTKPSIEDIRWYDYRFDELLEHNTITERQFLLMVGPPSIDHYRLWTWFSYQFNGIRIAEIGTMDGCGAIALAANPANEVYTYDIALYAETVLYPKNAHSRLLYSGYMDEVVKSEFIIYDAAHKGVEEREFLDELIKRKWHGMLVLDDIHFNPPMRKFWESITQYKEDWSDRGHESGTGVVWL